MSLPSRGPGGFRKDEDGQLILSMGIVLTFTLMLIASNAVDLSHVQSRNTSEIRNPYLAEYEQILDLFQSKLEWAVNGQDHFDDWETALETAVVTTFSTWDRILSSHGILIKQENMSYERSTSDLHDVVLTLEVSLTDGLRAIRETIILPVRILATDEWINVPGTDLHYRIPLVVSPSEFQRRNDPVSATINFTEVLNDRGVYDPFDPTTLTLIEHDNTTGLESFVLMQFDTAAGFHTSNNALGTVSWVLNGNTPADTPRYFYLYFDTLGDGSTSISTTSDLEMTADGWVNNSFYRNQLRTGESLRSVGQPDIGTGSPSWRFVDNGSLVSDHDSWDTWTIDSSGDVIGSVESTNGPLTRTWTFYAGSGRIDITDTWNNTGTVDFLGAFYTDELRYAGAGDPYASGLIDAANEPSAPTEANSSVYSYIYHEDHDTYYGYIFNLNRLRDVEWEKVAGEEIMDLFMDHSVSTTVSYHMFFGTSVSQLQITVRNIANPPVINRYPVQYEA